MGIRTIALWGQWLAIAVETTRATTASKPTRLPAGKSVVLPAVANTTSGGRTTACATRSTRAQRRRDTKAAHLLKDCMGKKTGGWSEGPKTAMDEEYMSLMAELGE